MKKFIEWLEGNVSRGRKVMLISAIVSNIIITYIILLLLAFGINITPFLGFYTAFLGLGLGAIGFYTGTAPKSKDNNSNNEIE